MLASYSWANENQSMAMLNTYGQEPRQIHRCLRSPCRYLKQAAGRTYIASPAGYGDEGKWVWMARISGQNKQDLIDAGYMNPATAWTDETTFGASNPTTGKWQWNDQGLNCTVYELLNYAEVQYCNAITAATNSQITITPDQTTTVPTYFKEAYFAGLNTSPGQYGGLIPIIAIYSIDWATYDAQHGITPPA